MKRLLAAAVFAFLVASHMAACSPRSVSDSRPKPPSSEATGLAEASSDASVSSEATSGCKPCPRPDQRVKDASRSECIDCHGDATLYRKPVIYLYPPRPTHVTVRVDVDRNITTTSPTVDESGAWRVLAQPSGRLVADGATYPYLFWEADAAPAFDLSTGFVVRGPDSRRFLSHQARARGLNEFEVEAFVDYWGPRLAVHRYNLVHFEGASYERVARLAITPQPDTVIRLFMVVVPLARPIEVAPQPTPSAVQRHGFVVVEWGGTELRGLR